MSLIVAGGLALLYSITGDWHQQSIWFAAGAGDSAAMLNEGQWYRLVTPLTLHADLSHLLSNCLLGGFLLHFFFHLTGNGIGLLALLGSAALGNLLNVLGHGPGHLFVGFSTAIFSVIGMLCTISHAGRSGRPFLHVFMPIMAGLALLAFLGSSGERTDLGGHLFGLLSGLIFGNLVRLPWFLVLRGLFYPANHPGGDQFVALRPLLGAGLGLRWLFPGATWQR
jgi:rhomboid protease GluP